MSSSNLGACDFNGVAKVRPEALLECFSLFSRTTSSYLALWQALRWWQIVVVIPSTFLYGCHSLYGSVRLGEKSKGYVITHKQSVQLMYGVLGRWVNNSFVSQDCQSLGLFGEFSGWQKYQTSVVAADLPMEHCLYDGRRKEAEAE